MRWKTKCYSPYISPSLVRKYLFIQISKEIGNRYDLLQFNCNHFAQRFANMLQASRPIPDKVYRITDCLNSFRCLIPDCILNGQLDWFDFGEGDSYEEVRESVHAEMPHK